MSEIITRVRNYLQLTRLDRPIGSFLLLWPTLWALWLAGRGQPDADIVVIFIFGTVVMRAAGCVINDYADRNFDGHVERTANRPLASGRISSVAALTLFAGLLFIALLLVLQLNILSLGVACLALAITMIYPFSKRYTHLPQCILGIAFSMGIPMAYAALQNTVPLEAFMLILANFLWIMAYDTEYAMADRDDDILIGIKSTAILFGRYDRLAIGLLQTGALIVLCVLGVFLELTRHYFLGIILGAFFLAYQHVLIAGRDPAKCFQAFLNNTWVGAVIFCGIVLAFMPS